eukprot:8861910-Pyramimonas_sp.AAC.1
MKPSRWPEALGNKEEMTNLDAAALAQRRCSSKICIRHVSLVVGNLHQGLNINQHNSLGTTNRLKHVKQSRRPEALELRT